MKQLIKKFNKSFDQDFAPLEPFGVIFLCVVFALFLIVIFS